jgi:hypothetical protein
MRNETSFLHTFSPQCKVYQSKKFFFPSLYIAVSHLLSRWEALPWRGDAVCRLEVLIPREPIARLAEPLGRLQQLSLQLAPAVGEDARRVDVLPKVVGVAVAVKVEAEARS